MEKKCELLAPAGNFEKLKVAFKFGADAVYLGGKQFGLRAFADNFSSEELKNACAYAHNLGKKVYVTVNIYARNNQLEEIKKYAKTLESAGVDAVIVSDIGVIKIFRENSNLAVHVSTQANITNKFAAEEFVRLGAERVILARELSLAEIKEICAHLKDKAEVEVFVHGAMCISYSGRCLLSNYLSGREANAGACAQSCRWGYTITNINRKDEQLQIEEDLNGTYILNSKDLCLIEHLKDLANAGVTSFKIEGRMKSELYVATVVNAYRRALSGEKLNFEEELNKTGNRKFTKGFAMGEKQNEFYKHAGTNQTHEFMAIVLENEKNGKVLVEQRNNFAVGDTLEVLSDTANFNKTFEVTKIENENGEFLINAKNVQEKLFLACPFNLKQGDILRRKK